MVRTDSTQANDLYWDPFDPALRVDPYPLWKRLRDEAPAWHNERYDFYVLSRYQDVEAAHLDAKTYSSAHGTTIEMMSPEPYPVGQIIFMDPPEHTYLRRLVSRAFTARTIGGLEPQIRAIARRLLDAHVGESGFDYVADFGALLPPEVISTFLGVPESDREELRHLIDLIFHIEDGVGMVNPTAMTAMGKVTEYLFDQVKERRDHPTDDLLGHLATAEIPDDHGGVRRLEAKEAADFGLVLFVAGTETVARLIGYAGALLSTHPDQRAEIVTDHGLIPGAIEELLRFEPPSPVQARWTTTDVEIHGTTMPANSKVVLLTGAACRDERKFPDPDRFDVHRAMDRHVAFGYGIHLCIGAALARAEGRVALEETFARWPTWEADLDNAELLFTSTVRGYCKLPITVG